MKSRVMNGSQVRAAFLALLMAVTMLVATPAALAASDTFLGSLDAAGDKWDGNKINVTETGLIEATLDWDDPSADLNLFIKDPSGAGVANSTSKVARPEVVTFNATETGEWTVGVKAKTGSSDYTLDVTHSTGAPPPPPPPVGDLTGDGDADTDRWNAHKIQITEPGVITASLDWASSGADLHLLLKSPDGITLAKSKTSNKPESFAHSVTQTGQYKLVAVFDSGASSYSISWEFTPGVPSGGSATYETMFGYKGHAGFYPYGTDWDSTTNTWVVGSVWSSRVDRFSADGAFIETVSQHAQQGDWGGIGQPFDVDVDPLGNIWVADQSNHRVVQFDGDGNWMKTIGEGGGPESYQVYEPWGCGGGALTTATHLMVHPDTMNLYVSDPRCQDIYVYDYDGRYLYNFDIDLKHYSVFKPKPRGIDIDDEGNVYVVEYQTRRVLVFDSDGNSLWDFDAVNSMKDPRGLVVDNKNDLLYVVTARENQVFQFDLDGNHLDTWSSCGSNDFFTIRYPAVDDNGNLLVGDTWGYEAHKCDKDGNSLPWATPRTPPPDGGFNQVNGIGIDPATGFLYTADTFENRIQVFATVNPSNGELWHCKRESNCPAWQFQFGARQSQGTNSEGLSNPRAMTFADDIAWVDGGNAVNAYEADGTFISRFGQNGKDPGDIASGPKGIRVIPGPSNNGVVYVTDRNNCRLQLFDFQGTLLDHMSSCGNGTNQMNAPWQLDVVGDLVYVIERGNNRISIWDTTTNTVAATYNPSFDGTKLKNPRGIVVDPARQWIYVGDTDNNRVVRLRLDGSDPQVVTRGADVPEGKLKGPEYLEFDTAGNLYVSDNNQHIYVFSIN